MNLSSKGGPAAVSSYAPTTAQQRPSNLTLQVKSRTVIRTFFRATHTPTTLRPAPPGARKSSQTMVAPCHLGQHRTPGGATDTPPEPVDEEHLQRHVRGAGCDKDHERTAEAPIPRRKPSRKKP